ncbi:MAG TPA: proline--tRNA ligase [Verrucomicrobiae bacterium]|nr:proline--tRNA ligase [Verrucomicrobiae bacterium]
MRQSKLFGRTLREAPAEAQTPGHRLMLRAAIAKPLAAGLYTWLPLGLRVAKKVERIIREEQNRIGAQEMEMPVLTPAEPWKQTGRWDTLEPITFRTKDHNGREFMVSYTHEEFVHLHAMQEIQSYKQMPQIVYHFQSKGRDEARPRAGLLRVREFVMKDAYSFDVDQAGLEKSYAAEYGAYERTFQRMGLDAISVESDTGAMGGDVAHEFQVLTEVGEDRVAICSNCDYRANLEKATRYIEGSSARADGVPARSEIATPGTESIEALEASLGQPRNGFLKTILMRDQAGKVVAVVLPGDREVNEAKLRKTLATGEVKFANDADVVAAGAVPGYIGPIGLKTRVLVDTGVGDRPYIAGANKKDAHLRDVVLGRDFKGERIDAADVREGDTCPRCKTGTLHIKRGVEVGNIFAYGTYYSDKMGAAFIAEDGTHKPFVGGSYGIGVGRAVQTIIETHYDDKGIVWPPQVAPYHAHVIALPVNDDDVRTRAEALVAELEKRGVEVLYDDRDESAGVKFADADLIGIPLRVTVSKRNLKENAVELKLRSASDSEMVPLDGATERITETVRSWPR